MSERHANRQPSDDDLSDAESDLVSIASDEFPGYFTERNGRLFHSSPTVPYPLPVDTPEQERLTVQDKALRIIMGQPFVGPVPEALAPTVGRRKFAVDFCCGKGQWIEHMAARFPEAIFVGLDIVPIATTYPPENVSFEVHDMSEPTRFEEGTIDLVHIRDCSMAVANYATLIQEASRILRPGGLLVFGEFSRFPAFHTTSPQAAANPRAVAPYFCRFYDLVNQALASRGLLHVSDVVPTIVRQLRTFHTTTPISYQVPIGDWYENERLGRAYRRATSGFMDSIRPLLAQQGLWPQEYLDALYSSARLEIESVNQFRPVAQYFTGFSIRR
ncbi:S-adenosyl-L-methionine-dependent methyltransferase [Hymenopellis radicata]|nr:S-adenosyl-L-methionine-dependent methyltransferase [Hymenopellis radicata]